MNRTVRLGVAVPRSGVFGVLMDQFQGVESMPEIRLN